MATAYLRFTDESEAGHITVEGGIEGVFDPSSASHIAVMRLAEATDELGKLLSSLPPVDISLDGDDISAKAKALLAQVQPAPASDERGAAS